MFKFKNDIVHGALFDMDGTMFDTERLRLSRNLETGIQRADWG